MAKTNVKRTDSRIDKSTKLAGGFGTGAAVQNAEALLRRAVLASLLWEDAFYESGKDGAENVANLISQVEPQKVFDLAIEARTQQKLRHIPLFIAREMARLEKHKSYVSELLPKIILRADELAEFVSMYWKDRKQPLSAQVKKGLARAFKNFNAYQFAKYRGRDDSVSLRDVLFLTHVNPGQQSDLFKQIAEDTLPIPNTWENRLSAGENKKAVFEDMIAKGELGGLAFLRNLRNMEEAGVSPTVVRNGFLTVNSKWLLPINYLAAAKYSPRYEREIESLMLKGFSQLPKLTGYTIFVVDVSGSMGGQISGKSEMSRLDVACAMAMMAAEVCERVSIYATAGSDPAGRHDTKLVPNRHGFGLIEAIKQNRLGGGGIFTRQCLEYIKSQEHEKVDRIIIFSDSQDCDRLNKVPAPFGDKNYIVDVSSHARGINYKGVWTAEISGWSDHFLTYIAALEGNNWSQED